MGADISWNLVGYQKSIYRHMAQDKMIPWPRSHITNSLWSHNGNLVKFILALTIIVIIQPGHNFAHATTAQVQNYDMI